MSSLNLLRQSGQAMTEFVVTVSYVFLGLLVIVPTFGKIMDLQFQTQQASRYIAWERTVWFDQNESPDESRVSSAYWESVATRDDDDLMSSMENRFFYGTGTGVLRPVTESDIDAVTADASPIWTYVQSKNSMYGGTTLVDESLDAEDTPSVAYDILGVFQDGMDLITTPLDFALNVIGGDNDDFLDFAYEIENYYSPIIQTQVNISNSKQGGTGEWDRQDDGSMGSGIEDAIFQSWDGKIEARSAILADGWNTQSLDHYQQRADDFVPSSLFDNDLFDLVITAASFLDGAIGSLDFGAVGIEPMPAEEGEVMDVECDDGFCYYDD